MTDTDVTVPYPFSEAVGLHMDPRYAELRQECPVLRVRVPYGDDAWLLTGYEEVKIALSDPRFSRAAAGPNEARLTPLVIRTSVMGTDPPDHTRLRRLVANSFSKPGAERLRGKITELADTLLDAIVAQGPPADLVESFASPLSGLLICEMLGVPYEDRERFQHWLEAFFSITVLPAEEIAVRIEAMYDYIASLVDRRRAEPSHDDLLSSLVRTRDEDGSCSEQELIDLANVLLLAGYHTTASQLASSLYVLLTQPKQLHLVKQCPNLIPQAVEELLRYVPLIAHVTFARYATEDVWLGGVLIRAGEAVLPAIPSANRDPAAFSDPDRLDFHRDDNPHVAFGHGLHHCLGAALVRAQMQVALSALVHRFDDLRLAVPEDDVQWIRGTQARSPIRLPATWGPEPAPNR